MRNITRQREDRAAEARAAGVTARLATERLAEAAAAMRLAEAAVATAFELKRDAEQLCDAASIETRVGMNRDLAGAWRVSEDSDLPQVLR